MEAEIDYALSRADNVAWFRRTHAGIAKLPSGAIITTGLRGTADFIGQTRDGLAFAIEAKWSEAPRRNRKGTANQKAFLRVVSENGGRAGIARSVEGALAIISNPNPRV